MDIYLKLRFSRKDKDNLVATVMLSSWDRWKSDTLLATHSWKFPRIHPSMSGFLVFLFLWTVLTNYTIQTSYQVGLKDGEELEKKKREKRRERGEISKDFPPWKPLSFQSWCHPNRKKGLFSVSVWSVWMFQGKWKTIEEGKRRERNLFSSITFSSRKGSHENWMVFLVQTFSFSNGSLMEVCGCETKGLAMNRTYRRKRRMWGCSEIRLIIQHIFA